MSSISTWIALLGGATGLATLLGALFNRRKLAAEAEGTLIGSREKVIEAQQRDLDRLGERLADLDDYVELLVSALRSAGVPVPPHPRRRADAPG